MIRSRRAPALLLSGLVAACGTESEGGDVGVSPLERDSAEVRIVENGQMSPSTWRVRTSPLFTVGWGPDGPEFTWVQSGLVLPDGEALIGEFADGTIYRVGPGGSVLATWGGKGEGPGEYQAIDAILLRGDSIVISDARLHRLTLLSSEGELLTTRRLPGTPVHQVSSVLTDGRILLVPGEGYGAVAKTQPEWVFEYQPILAATSDGSMIDTLAELPHLRRWYGTRAANPGPVPVKGRAGGFSTGFAWARADQREVRWYDGTGRLVQIARWDEEPVPITPHWRARRAEVSRQALRSSGVGEERIAAQLAQLDEGLNRHDGPLPYWDSFLVDRSGNAWLREFSLPGQPSSRWRVIANDGRLVGWVEVPNVISILDITDDRILAVRLDDLDVPAVVMLELDKD